MSNYINLSSVVSFLLSIMISSIIAILFNIGIINNIIPSLIITIIISTIIFILFFYLLVFSKFFRYSKKYGYSIIFGTLGSVAFSSFLLSIIIDTGIINTLLYGINTFFIIFLIIEFIKLILCILNTTDENILYENYIKQISF